jgi:hypothetical protein
MTIASTHSAQFSQLERQFSEMHQAIQTLLLRTPETHYHNIAGQTSQLQIVTTSPQATTYNLDISQQRSTTTAASTPAPSPEKKRIRQTNEESHPNTDVQEHSAQYTASTPADSDI